MPSQPPTPNSQPSSWLPPGQGAPLLVVISGPTAVGKTTVLRRMRERGLPYCIGVTATTRPRREGEVDGVDYWFVERERFERMIANGELLEHAIVHGRHYYGIPRAPLREALARGEDVIVPPEVQGAATVRDKVPGVVTIFVAAPSFEDLERRIMHRGLDDMEQIKTRLATARREMGRVHEFQFLVINDEGRLDETVDAIDAIIRSEKHRVGRVPIVL
ncbi:MAG: guanylate kinase [Chloroflexi bacterium]|nr:guanylate kinase [Chloroflexota bacterium]